MTPGGLDRRQLLRHAAALATAAWWPRSGWAQPVLRSNPFTLGVASGSPRMDGVVLWTRLLPDPSVTGPVTVRWEVAEADSGGQIVQRGEALADAALAHSVHVEVQGLAPDRWYTYRFMVGGVGNDWVSPVGRTRTLPQPDALVQRLRLAYASCQRWEHGFFSAWRHLVADAPDLVLFLGDYIYEYPDAARAVRHPTGGWVLNLADYRERYALYKSDAHLQAAHAACPWLVTWDDHEVQNDHVGLTPGNSGPPVADFAARRAAAYQAWYEHMPVRASVLTRALAGLSCGAEMRLYDRLVFGRLAHLHLLDGRQYRSPQACTPDGRVGSATLNPAHCAAWNDPQRSFLGHEQERWLDRAFARGSAGWNVIGQSTLLGRRDFSPGAGERLWNDGWDGYAPARQRLTEAMAGHRLANPVVLGGDVHENWVGHVKADYMRSDSASVGVEFCGTSISSRSGGNARLPERLAENPHFVFADAEQRGYGLAEFTPQRLTTTLRVVDDATRPDSGVRTLAAFEVASGRPVVERR